MTAPAVFDRGAWLAERRTGIGASDVAPILGMSTWGSPWSVWAEKVSLLPPEDASEFMEFGQRAEPMLASWFEDRTGLFVGNAQRLARHPDEPWMLATLDGEVYEGNTTGDRTPLGVAEWKTDRPSSGWDEVPDPYQIQVQWQLAVTGHDHAWVGCLHGRLFRVYELDRDQAVIDRLVELCGAFWRDHVLTGVPPAADGHPATSWTLGQLWDGEGDEVALDDLAPVIDDLRRKRELRAELDDDIARHENRVKAAMGDATVALVDGRPAVTWKPSTTTRVDTKALRAAYSRTARKFETTTTSRRFLLKTPKD